MSRDLHQFTLLHRYMCGLTVFCVVIAVIGGAIAGASAPMITWRAGLVAVGFMFVEKLLIKIWASWEDIQQGASTRSED